MFKNIGEGHLLFFEFGNLAIFQLREQRKLDTLGRHSYEKHPKFHCLVANIFVCVIYQCSDGVLFCPG